MGQHISKIFFNNKYECLNVPIRNFFDLSAKDLKGNKYLFN